MKRLILNIKGIFSFDRPFSKVLLVFAAFLVVILSSRFIMDRTLNQKLTDHIEEKVDDMQASISYILNEPTVALHFFSDMVLVMMERGESPQVIEAYLEECSQNEFKEKIGTFSYHSLYGYFDVYDAFFDGRGWVPPDTYVPAERPWYTMAVEAGNGIVISPVYIDTNLGVPVVFYSRCLKDAGGNVLGVVAMNVPFGPIQQLLSSNPITDNSYGYIVDEQAIVVAHPNEGLIGELMGAGNSDFAAAAESIRQGRDVSMHNVSDYRGVRALLFSRVIDNGLWVNFVIDEAEYYKEMHDMIKIISLVALVMAAALSILLVSVDSARSKAVDRNMQKSNFLANMSHEMRTPMNVIVGLTELMLEDGDPVDLREKLKKINTAGNTLLAIVNDVLDISKIEAGKLELMPVKYDVASNVNDVVALNLIRIGDKPITFRLDINEEMPSSLYGDDIRIKQILNNLLGNAFKYTHKGTVTLGIYCRREAATGRADDNVWVDFTISDTGIGIKKDDLAKIFTDYNQVDVRANRRIEGTGLGLSITKSLVELLGGEISVESDYGVGTTFRVRILQRVVSDTVIGRETAENLRNFIYLDKKDEAREKLARPDLSGVRVLLVDDLPTNLDVAAGMLRKYKMQVDCVESGRIAVDRIEAGEPVYDAILMDHMMPEMDGMEATALIRALGTKYAAEIPIVALTANAIAGNEKMFMDNGFNAYLAKPISVMMLDKVVRRWFGKGSGESKPQ